MTLDFIDRLLTKHRRSRARRNRLKACRRACANVLMPPHIYALLGGSKKSRGRV